MCCWNLLQRVLGRGEGGIANTYVLGIIEGTYVGMCEHTGAIYNFTVLLYLWWEWSVLYVDSYNKRLMFCILELSYIFLRHIVWSRSLIIRIRIFICCAHTIKYFAKIKETHTQIHTHRYIWWKHKVTTNYISILKHNVPSNWYRTVHQIECIINVLWVITSGSSSTKVKFCKHTQLEAQNLDRI